MMALQPGLPTVNHIEDTNRKSKLNGHFRTKWVLEELVRAKARAQSCGLKVAGLEVGLVVSKAEVQARPSLKAQKHVEPFTRSWIESKLSFF